MSCIKQKVKPSAVTLELRYSYRDIAGRFVFWNVTPRQQVNGYLISNDRSAFIFRVKFLVYLTLKLKALRSLEMTVTAHQ